jgi:hypothetical protein
MYRIVLSAAVLFLLAEAVQAQAPASLGPAGRRAYNVSSAFSVAPVYDVPMPLPRPIGYGYGPYHDFRTGYRMGYRAGFYRGYNAGFMAGYEAGIQDALSGWNAPYPGGPILYSSRSASRGAMAVRGRTPAPPTYPMSGYRR